MNQRSLSVWLKIAIVCLAVVGAAVYAFVLPQYGRTIEPLRSAYSSYYRPWLIFTLATAIPCYLALICAWRVAAQIGRDNSFSYINARMLKYIAVLAAVDGMYFFVGILIFWLIGVGAPGTVLLALLPAACAAVVSIASAALSHLIRNAADMKQDSDLTI